MSGFFIAQSQKEEPLGFDILGDFRYIGNALSLGRAFRVAYVP
jgi:hypothetical protein